jgi:hypothetical protein
MMDDEWFKNDLAEVQTAVRRRRLADSELLKRGKRPPYVAIDVTDVATLCYAARNVDTSSVSGVEHRDIVQAVRAVEDELGVKYAYDTHHGDTND